MDEPIDQQAALSIVASGYDRIAERYAEWSATEVRDDARPRYLAVLEEALPRGAMVLELGCGGGGPTTRTLAAYFTLTGVDISARQIELARKHVPRGTFIQANMLSLDLPPSSFDAVAAFYSLTHLPHGELPDFLGRLARWLRPGGLLVASFGAACTPGVVEPDWLGVPMYFSGNLPAENERLVQQAGFALASARTETILEHDRPVAFHWIVARKRDG